MNIEAARSGAKDMNGGGRENAEHGAAESVWSIASAKRGAFDR